MTPDQLPTNYVFYVMHCILRCLLINPSMVATIIY